MLKCCRNFKSFETAGIIRSIRMSLGTRRDALARLADVLDHPLERQFLLGRQEIASLGEAGAHAVVGGHGEGGERREKVEDDAAIGDLGCLSSGCAV